MTEACAGAFQKFPTLVDSTGTGGFSHRFVKYALQIISNYNKFLQILSNYLHISKEFCNFASSFGNEPEAITKKLTKKNEIMKAKANKQNVIERIAKGGFNLKDAEKMVAKFWELAERRGCETVRDYYQTITWFWAVA